MTEMTEALIVRQSPQPGVVRLVFNRPEKLNALSGEMVARFEAEPGDHVHTFRARSGDQANSDAKFPKCPSPLGRFDRDAIGTAKAIRDDDGSLHELHCGTKRPRPMG